MNLSNSFLIFIYAYIYTLYIFIYIYFSFLLFSIHKVDRKVNGKEEKKV